MRRSAKVALSNGVATFAWAGEIGGRNVEVRRLVNGRLSDVAILSSAPRGDLVTDLDVSEDGRTVVWTHVTGHEALVRSRHWTKGRWGRTRTLGEGRFPDVASNDRGGTIVTYRQEAADGTLLLSRRLRPQWLGSAQTDRPDDRTTPMDASALSLNNRGVATAVWGSGRVSLERFRCRLQTARKQRRQRWSPPIDLGRFGGDQPVLRCPTPALTTEGTTVAWTRQKTAREVHVHRPSRSPNLELERELPPRQAAHDPLVRRRARHSGAWGHAGWAPAGRSPGARPAGLVDVGQQTSKEKPSGATRAADDEYRQPGRTWC